MESLPIIGKEYDCYDDGKIWESRKYKVVIKDIIPIKDANCDLVNPWIYAKHVSPHLFAKRTDYLIVADDYEREPTITKQIFARTKDGGWFGVGRFFNCGRLFVNNKK